ncbi:MAG TPA: PilZ domain-containing protein [Verrucomicrobiae bacterium]|nr:PilZ domain-containing protein [Verrucomicrobiae bacterium]
MLRPEGARGAEQRGNQRRFFRQSIELPVAVSVRGLPAPVYGTLMNISESGCRVRSLILLDRDRIVEFTLHRPGRAEIALRGRVVTRVTPHSDAGYEYGVSFEELDAPAQDALAREIVEMQRRAAAARAEAREAEAAAGGEGNQRRTAVRTVAMFPVRYRPTNRSANVGEASDVSAGGLRLLCGDALPVGSEIELRFTLPNDVLSVYPKAEDRVEISPFGQRRVHIPDNRRPFEEMTVRGRVLARLEPAHGRECYGVGFTDIDGYQREEIARFAHAAQLVKLRNTR